MPVCFFKTSQGQEILFCKGPENILGFTNQEARPKILCRLLYNKRENKFAQIFIDGIQNIITIVYNFLVTEKTGIILRGITFSIIGIQS